MRKPNVEQFFIQLKKEGCIKLKTRKIPLNNLLVLLKNENFLLIDHGSIRKSLDSSTGEIKSYTIKLNQWETYDEKEAFKHIKEEMKEFENINDLLIFMNNKNMLVLN